MNFGEKLRKIRHDKHMSQQDLADASALSAAAIKSIERAAVTDPKWSTVLALCCGLEVSPEVFVPTDGEEWPT